MIYHFQPDKHTVCMCVCVLKILDPHFENNVDPNELGSADQESGFFSDMNLY